MDPVPACGQAPDGLEVAVDAVEVAEVLETEETAEWTSEHINLG
jgi:hypothetical protein